MLREMQNVELQGCLEVVTGPRQNNPPGNTGPSQVKAMVTGSRGTEEGAVADLRQILKAWLLKFKMQGRWGVEELPELDLSNHQENGWPLMVLVKI